MRATKPLAGLWLLLAVLCAGAQSDPPIIKTSEVKPGMEGYGFSVFEGTKIERFDLEVVGVLKNWAPKSDIVLVRLEHPLLRRTGVISGMSGSPVFVEGKLLGAVAYGWPWSKEPICGIQPITEMMRASKIEEQSLERQKEQGVDADARRRGLAQVRKAVKTALEARSAEGEVDERRLMVRLGKLLLPRGMTGEAGPVAGKLTPIPFSLCVNSRLTDAELLQRVFSGTRVIPVSVPASVRRAGAEGKGTSKLADIKVEPGMPVGASLISGDIDWTGLGTLTHVDGKKILAFGHSMYGIGDVKFPLAAGDIVTVMSSQWFSFKMGGSRGIIGTLTHDLEPAIVGRVGQVPPMIPYQVHLKGTLERTYNLNVAVHRDLTPMLMTFASWDLGGYLQGDEMGKTFEGRFVLKMAGRQEPVEIANVYDSFFFMVFESVLMPMATLMNNPFQKVKFEEARLDLRIVPREKSAVISNARSNLLYVKPGQEVTISVALLPRPTTRKPVERLVRQVTLKIPEDVEPASTVSVLVCGGNQSNMIDMYMNPALRNPKNLEQLIRLVSKVEPSTNLVARASVIKQGLSYNGEPMPDLPPSMSAALMHDLQTDWVQPLVEDKVHRMETEWIINGSRVLTLKVIK